MDSQASSRTYCTTDSGDGARICILLSIPDTGSVPGPESEKDLESQNPSKDALRWDGKSLLSHACWFYNSFPV